MAFAGVSAGTVLFAAIASFLFGGIWYGLLSKPWLEALGKSEAELKAGARPMPYLLGLTMAAEILMAVMLAGVIGHLGPGQVTVENGLLSAFLIWLGFVVTTLAVNHGYQGSPWSLTAIDAGHWLGVLLIQGLIIGWAGAG